MRVIVTGSRTWTDYETILKTLGALPSGTTIVHGGCPKGADWLADDAAFELGLPVNVYDADWNKGGRSAGPRRNQQMVDDGADLCIAFRQPGRSNGTDDCIRRAKAAGIEVRVIEPVNKEEKPE